MISSTFFKDPQLSHSPLPSPSSLKEELPLTSSQHRHILQSREEVARILEGKDERLLLIIGPCSVHNITAARRYANKLKALAEELKDSFLILMRVHGEKPRTTLGWKGFVSDPYLDGSEQLEHGLREMRRFFLELAKMNLPIATEILDPFIQPYFSDLISWAQIGARTCSSQVHRQLASSLPNPVGFKNNTDGNIRVAVDAVMTSQAPHCFVSLSPEGRVSHVKSKGNPHSHIVLRGGLRGSNYDVTSINQATEFLRRAGAPCRFLIDCSHDNARGNPNQQELVFEHVIDLASQGQSCVMGAILESYHKAGRQLHTPHVEDIDPDVSLTDPCLDWESTESLLRTAAEWLEQEALKRHKRASL